MRSSAKSRTPASSNAARWRAASSTRSARQVSSCGRARCRAAAPSGDSPPQSASRAARTAAPSPFFPPRAGSASRRSATRAARSSAVSGPQPTSRSAIAARTCSHSALSARARRAHRRPPAARPCATLGQRPAHLLGAGDDEVLRGVAVVPHASGLVHQQLDEAGPAHAAEIQVAAQRLDRGVRGLEPLEHQTLGELLEEIERTPPRRGARSPPASRSPQARAGADPRRSRGRWRWSRRRVGPAGVSTRQRAGPIDRRRRMPRGARPRPRLPRRGPRPGRRAGLASRPLPSR